MIKLACASLSFDGFGDSNFIKTFELAPKAGLRFIEFNCWYPSYFTTRETRNLKDRCTESGLLPAAIHIGHFGGLDFREVTKDVCHKIRAMEMAKELGCKRICATGAPRGQKGGIGSVTTCLKEIVPAAEELDMLVCVENHANSNIENIDDYQRIFDSISSKNVGVCMDTGHFDAAGVDMAEFIDKFHARINHIHLKENKGFGSLLFTRFGEGTTDNCKIIERMIGLGYEGFLTIELCIEEDDGLPVGLSDVVKAVEMFKKYETI